MTAQPKISSAGKNAWGDTSQALARDLHAWIQLLIQSTSFTHCVISLETPHGKSDFYDGELNEGCRHHLAELLVESNLKRQRVSYFKLDGPVRCYFSFPVVNETSQFLGSVALWDVVDREIDLLGEQVFHSIAHTLAQFLSATQRAERAEIDLREKTDFTSLLSHEIRTSVTAIVGIADILTESHASSEYVSALDVSARQLRALVSDVLDYNKMNAGKMELLQVPIRLSDFLTDIIKMYTPLAHHKGLVLKSLLEGDATAVVVGDSVRLTQVLSNLVVNAIKFTERGSVTLHLIIEHLKEVDANRVNVTFRVSDTGPGVSIHQQKLLFTPFVQAASTSSQKIEGTGLGLSIAYDLVRVMGGELCLTSSPGDGSTFFFALTFSEAQPVKPSTQSGVGQVFSGQRVLVVEDNLMNRMVVEQLLSKWNLNLTMAGSGAEAVELIQQNNFDLVLMDVQMPGMNGYDTTKKIRDMRGMSLPVIGLTGFVDAKTRNAGMQVGMNDLVAKPLRATELFSKMAQYLSPKS